MDKTTTATAAAAALLQRLHCKGLHLSAMPGGTLRVWPAVRLDEATREAIAEGIAQHRAGLLALLSPLDADALEDDRHRCRDCYHLQRKGDCAMAAQGRLPGAPAWYTPPRDVLARCPLFCPLPY